MTQLRSHRRGSAAVGEATALRARPGVSLIEVIVAVTLLSVSLLALARISPMLSQYGRRNDMSLNRAYVLQQQGDRLMAMRYTVLLSSLPVGTTTKTITVRGMKWQRSVTRLDSVGMQKLTLVVKPLSPIPSLRRPDTLVLWRGTPSGCALNMNSCK